MKVEALVEYEIVGNDKYIFIDRYEDEWNNLLYSVWKARFIRSLLARGIVCSRIKEISVEYEK